MDSKANMMQPYFKIRTFNHSRLPWEGKTSIVLNQFYYHRSSAATNVASGEIPAPFFNRVIAVVMRFFSF
jgi:hypothetical protein